MSQPGNGALEMAVLEDHAPMRAALTNAHIAAQARAAGAVAFIGKDRLFDELRPLIGAVVTLMKWMHGNASGSLVPADSPRNA